jgi:hypothetical protein
LLSYRHNYGANHPEAPACRLNLACDLSARQVKKAAYSLARKVLMAYQDALGARHPFALAPGHAYLCSRDLEVQPT